VFYLLKHSRSSTFSMTPGVIVSAALHVTLLGALVYERVQSANSGEETWTEVIEGLTYIAPPDVSSAASKIQVRYEAGGGAEGDRPANAEEGSLLAQGEGAGDAAVASVSGGEEANDQVAAESDDVFENAFSVVEVELAASRDPGSAAPVYPRHLMTSGIEGYAALRFVVDTLGRIEAGSVRVIDATHPEFAAAVRAAMPGMKFTPARLGDRPVRQLAEQLFRFQIVTAAPAPEPGKIPPTPGTLGTAGAPGPRRPR
jgi:protein TonB